MCTYNGAKFLCEQLNSIAAQSRIPDELLICDDGSGDATIEIIHSFQRNAPFPLRLKINAANRGSTKNFEQAIGLCSGDVIALADQDDIWNPQKLEVLERALTRNPSVGLVFSDAEVIDENQKPLGYRLWKSVGLSNGLLKRFVSGSATRVLLKRNVVTGATMAFRSEYRKLLLPIPDLWIHDGWIALLLASVTEIAAIDEPLIRYRRHPYQQIGPLDLDFAESLAHSMRTGADDYYLSARRYQVLRNRLVAMNCDTSASEAVRELERKVRHLTARAEISKWPRPRRVPLVLKELACRRYGRYSEGWRSAAKDLLFSDRSQKEEADCGG